MNYKAYFKQINGFILQSNSFLAYYNIDVEVCAKNCLSKSFCRSFDYSDATKSILFCLIL